MQRIVLTPGEPAGIGPDLVVQLAQQGLLTDVVVVADPELLQSRAKSLGATLNIILYDPTDEFSLSPHSNTVTVLPVHLATPACAGKLNSDNATYVLKTLTLAAEGCLNGEFAALVTGPVHKGVINEAGIKFSGHTEFFANLAHTADVVMMLVADTLRVALATTHLPLRAVADAITAKQLRTTLQILHAALQQSFGISNPRILVCGLNPHAGEGGYLGREEIEVIIPVLEQLRASGMQLMGPLPADTLFIPERLAQADAVLAMYHDQGLPVLKHVGFHHSVNITLGLPFIRTSVDHGTALELAGSGQADSSSLRAAIEQARQLVRFL